MAQNDANDELQKMGRMYGILSNTVNMFHQNWLDAGIAIPHELQETCTLLTAPNPFAGHTLAAAPQVAQPPLDAEDSDVPDNMSTAANIDDDEPVEKALSDAGVDIESITNSRQRRPPPSRRQSGIAAVRDVQKYMSRRLETVQKMKSRSHEEEGGGKGVTRQAYGEMVKAAQAMNEEDREETTAKRLTLRNKQTCHFELLLRAPNRE